MLSFLNRELIFLLSLREKWERGKTAFLSRPYGRHVRYLHENSFNIYWTQYMPGFSDTWYKVQKESVLVELAFGCGRKR
jgi:hypothetical protein